MKPTPKMRLIIAGLVVAFAGLLFGATIPHVLVRIDLATHSRVAAETGLTLPEGTRIVATAARTFSLADGDNYEWLIESDTPLTKWIASSSMHREDSDGISWANVRYFGEIAEIARAEDRDLALDSVWRSVHGGETTYLYVAAGRNVALLATFRP
ncbi:MAG: hypothetical protein JNK37_04415 [Verrucomicrobiales bacterium]|nr:hypothetical protein [Verrucomicrobiales bacterium]